MDVLRVGPDIEGWDAFPEHRTGTSGDLATAQWLADAIRAAGAEPGLDVFPFRRRVLRECAVEAAGRRAEGVPLFDGGLTDETGITCPLTQLDGTGRGIAVTTFGPSGRASTLSTARRGAFRAVVAGSAAPETVPGLALLNAPQYRQPYGPPVLQVATHDGEWLNAAAEAGTSARLVAHATIEDTEACNVQTRIPGRDASSPPLIIMTPRSSWWTSTAERGGGIAVWLACVPALREQSRRPRCAVHGEHGSRTRPPRPGALHGATPEARGKRARWIHLGANFAAADCHDAGTRLASGVRYQASPDLLDMGLETLTAFGIAPEAITPTNVRPGGEAQNIFDAGGQYISFLGRNPWFHHPDDRWPKPSISRKLSRFAAQCCISRALLQMLDVLFDDGSLLVINKPSGVSVLDDRTGAPCLLPELKAAYSRPRLVHRLDKGTSGVMLVALDRPAQRDLNRAFNARAVRKHYVGVICGHFPSGRTLTIDLPLKQGRKSVIGSRACARKYGRRGRDGR